MRNACAMCLVALVAVFGLAGSAKPEGLPWPSSPACYWDVENTAASHQQVKAFNPSLLASFDLVAVVQLKPFEHKRIPVGALPAWLMWSDSIGPKGVRIEKLCGAERPGQVPYRPGDEAIFWRATPSGVTRDELRMPPERLPTYGEICQCVPWPGLSHA